MAIDLLQFAVALPNKLYEYDKRLHFAWSFWLTVFFRLIWPTEWSLLFVVLLGVGKECWDHRYGSGFCLYDLTANLVGICLALFFTGFFPLIFPES